MDREILYTSIIVGIGLAYMKWDTFVTGFWNTVIAMIIAYLLQKLFLYILAYVGYSKYGITFSIERYSIKKESKRFNPIKKDYVERKIIINWIGYLLSIIFILITAGAIFPINTYVIKFKEELTSRIGKVKPKDIEIKNMEKIDLMILASTFYLLISGILYLIFLNFPIPISEYILHFSVLYILSRFIPWNYILAPIVTYYLKFEFSSYTEGDSWFSLDKAQILIRAAYIILSLALFWIVPVIFPIISFGIAILIWLWYKYKNI